MLSGYQYCNMSFDRTGEHLSLFRMLSPIRDIHIIRDIGVYENARMINL